MTSLFNITPTPPAAIKVRSGQQAQLSFTVTCDAAPDRAFDLVLGALLIGADGKGKEVDWLVVGPQRTLRMSGGMTETITITAKPTGTSPRGEHTLKLVIADKDQPNEVYGDSSPVICEVLGPPTGETPPPRPWWRGPWLILAIVGGLVVVGGGVLLVRMFFQGNDEPPGVGEPCRVDGPPCKERLVCEPTRKLCLAPEGAPCASDGECVAGRCRDRVCNAEPPGLGEACRSDVPPPCKDGLVCEPARKICLAAEGTPCTGDGDCITAKCRGNVCTGIDIDPSNSLAQFLDLTRGEPDLDLGAKATINTNDGTVLVDNRPVVVRSATLTQTSAPTIRVFIVRSLRAAEVTVIGANAIAVVSNGDIKIEGTFAASAQQNVPGAGGFNESVCQGVAGGVVQGGAFGGGGGGGFGGGGARGGSATTSSGVAAGGNGGGTAGAASLVPLRGGCNSGTYAAGFFGAGGGAVQLVSRTKIAISGAVAANGASYGGGGSGGGILLEAPVVEVSGTVVANGGGGAGGCLIPRVGENGRLDATPAAGGVGCDPESTRDGGSGGAGTTGPRVGVSINLTSTGGRIAFGGHGGGGVGRIRVNTNPGGLRVNGLFSPNPSTGPLATR